MTGSNVCFKRFSDRNVEGQIMPRRPLKTKVGNVEGGWICRQRGQNASYKYMLNVFESNYVDNEQVMKFFKTGGMFKTVF